MARPGNTPSKWTPERVADVAKLVADKLTAAQIARKLGLTRNAVIGVCHRAGLLLARSPYRDERQGLDPVGRLSYARLAEWTPERDDGLRRMYAVGCGVEEMVEALDGLFTHHSVRARLYRLGIKAKKLRPVKPVAVVTEPPPEGSVSLVGLERGQCRFPVGAATGARQMFCGAPKGDEGSYCPWHTLKVVDRSGRRDDRRPSAKFVMRGHY